VWPREFNAKGKSVIDVETRLDNMALGKEVSKASLIPLFIEKMAQNRIGFRSINQN
jgi:hypothetical protein